jgi:hypothetical protein
LGSADSWGPHISNLQNDKAAAIENLAKTEGAEMLHTMSGEEVKEALQSAFQAVDVDHKGWLTPDEVYEVLEMFGTGTLQMEPYQINAMVNAVDENDDGVSSPPRYLASHSSCFRQMSVPCSNLTWVYLAGCRMGGASGFCLRCIDTFG